MEKKNFEYEGTILTEIIEFFRKPNILGALKDDVLGFCMGVGAVCAPVAAAAAGAAGAAAVGTADAFLKGGAIKGNNARVAMPCTIDADDEDSYWIFGPRKQFNKFGLPI